MNRKGVFLIVMLCILAVAGAAHAVTLEQGWYAQIRSMMIMVYDRDGVPVPWGYGPDFNTPPGMYGPFQVTKDPTWYSRTVSVPFTVSGIAPGTSVELPILTYLADTSIIAVFDADWRTDYDASRMRLQLIQRDTHTGAVAVLWDQVRSGYAYGQLNDPCMASDIHPTGLAFRVMAVPEPGTLVSLIIGLVGTAALPLIRRRR